MWDPILRAKPKAVDDNRLSIDRGDRPDAKLAAARDFSSFCVCADERAVQYESLVRRVGQPPMTLELIGDLRIISHTSNGRISSHDCS
jgi:hypothetical protein